jgi:hypothetical protein
MDTKFFPSYEERLEIYEQRTIDTYLNVAGFYLRKIGVLIIKFDVERSKYKKFPYCPAAAERGNFPALPFVPL